MSSVNILLSPFINNYFSHVAIVNKQQQHLPAGHNGEYDNGEHSYRLGENHLADMTSDEITSYMNGLDLTVSEVEDGVQMVTDQELRSLNSSVDWREKVIEYLTLGWNGYL